MKPYIPFIFSLFLLSTFQVQGQDRFLNFEVLYGKFAFVKVYEAPEPKALLMDRLALFLPTRILTDIQKNEDGFIANIEDTKSMKGKIIIQVKDYKYRVILTDMVWHDVSVVDGKDYYQTGESIFVRGSGNSKRISNNEIKRLKLNRLNNYFSGHFNIQNDFISLLSDDW